MTGPSAVVVVHQDKDAMAQATAARLIAAVADAQIARGTASVVLTGGATGSACWPRSPPPRPGPP